METPKKQPSTPARLWIWGKLTTPPTKELTRTKSSEIDELANKEGL
ncbi:hypothetical protein [Vibrio vulnificus]|nr:hypothetical protein [Vibrio vulnificus]MBN8035048.1 hypothetical protein [Vibrio vulnificus]